MMYNYFKVIIRNFISDKMYTFIIVFGLAIGIAASLMIAQYIHFEMSFDKQYKDSDLIYYTYIRWENEKFSDDRPCLPAVGPLVGRSIPEVDAFTRIVPVGLSFGDEFTLRREEDGRILYYGREDGLYYADHDILKVFSIPMLAGDPATALLEPNTMILTESLAGKFFPEGDVLGKMLKLQYEGEILEFQITGLIENPLPNSSLRYSALFSINTVNSIFVKDDPNSRWLDDYWTWPIYQTFIKLQKHSEFALVEEKINKAARAKLTELEAETNFKQSIHLYPFQDFHFYQRYNSLGSGAVKFTGDKRLITYFGILAAIILMISWVNYINLTTSRALQRAKEVGLRKVNGARRKNLITQFLFEFLLLNAFSICLAFTMTQILFPSFARIIGSDAEWVFWAEPWFWLAIVLFLLLSTVISGIYPAFSMSNYNPSVVLKGTFSKSPKGTFLRKGLVLSQFTLSAFLLMSIYVIYSQLIYMQNKDLGLSADQVLVVRANDVDTALNRTTALHQLKLNIEQLNYVKSVSASDFFPGETGIAQWIFLSSGEENNQKPVGLRIISQDYFRTMGIELLHGRDFIDQQASDADKVIINEKAASVLGFEDPVSALGELITFIMNGKQYQIIGVVKDFSFSMKSIVSQEMFFHKHWATWNTDDPYNHFLIKLSTDNIQYSLKALESEWKKVFPADPFDYFFLDQYFNTFYKEEQRFAGVFGFFSVLGIFITCMGLFGLSLYNTSSRTKEIGIRKSLGGSARSIMWLFSKDYIRLVLLASVIGLPIGLWFLSKWLESYPNRITLQADIVVIPLVLMLCISMFTVGYHTYKTAHMDPVKSLKNE